MSVAELGPNVPPSSRPFLRNTPTLLPRLMVTEVAGLNHQNIVHDRVALSAAPYRLEASSVVPWISPSDPGIST
jgi:hypothetical protein